MKTKSIHLMKTSNGSDNEHISCTVLDRSGIYKVRHVSPPFLLPVIRECL